jgi:tetratricopeptide (TPR) repeat protein
LISVGLPSYCNAQFFPRNLITESENYGQVLRDCSLAITLNKISSKAYYRSALALLALDRLEEAIDSCDRCLSFDSKNVAVNSVKEKAMKAKQERRKTEEAATERKVQESKARVAMKRALKVCVPSAAFFQIENGFWAGTQYFIFGCDGARRCTLSTTLYGRNMHLVGVPSLALLSTT